MNAHNVIDSIAEAVFKVGDTLQSNVNAQGLVKGQNYTVVDFDPGMMGTVRYLVKSPSGKEFWIGNAHLLTTKVSESERPVDQCQLCGKNLGDYASDHPQICGDCADDLPDNQLKALTAGGWPALAKLKGLKEADHPSGAYFSRSSNSWHGTPGQLALRKKMDADKDKARKDRVSNYVSRNMSPAAKDLIGKYQSSKESNEVDADEVAPPGWEPTVKAMKKHKDVSNPWALSWYMKGKGYKSRK